MDTEDVMEKTLNLTNRKTGMNHDSILQHVAKHIRLDPEETEFFISTLQQREIKKKEIIIREGDIVNQEHFVVKGCFKSYSVDEKGSEHIIMFAPENWWMGDLKSFLTGNPTQYNIEAIEDSQILQISRSNLEILYVRVPKFERYFRILLQNALIAQFQRIDQNLSMTGDAKYLQFQHKYPGLDQRLPLKQIAAFLGITPEFLSIIRRRMLTGKGKQ